jgi:hypothetical protein
MGTGQQGRPRAQAADRSCGRARRHAIPNSATDAMFGELRRYWDEEQITEIMGVIAAMGFVTRWNDSLATPIEGEALAVGETHLAAAGWQAGKHLR